MKKRILSLAISAALVLTMLPAGALAAGDKGTPPVYNKATGCYEISTPDQLLYLSGSWKDGAPRDGHYVLTADIDMSGVKGFKPIASKKDKGFIGTFDGQFHAIKGLRVEYEKEIRGSVRLCRQSGRSGVYQECCAARLLRYRSAERRRSGRRKLRYDYRLCCHR